MNTDGSTPDDLPIPTSNTLRDWLNAGERMGKSIARQTKMHAQRASRGWADEDWWNLDTHLCHHLGRLLIASAEHGLSFPNGTTRDEWAASLRRHGGALVAYDSDEPSAVRGAQESLRWVADTLTQLWD